MDPSVQRRLFVWRQQLPAAAAVFAVALALRLVYLLSAADRTWPHSVAYEGDAVIWARAAMMFARGDAPDDGVPHRFYAIAHLMNWFSGAEGTSNYLGFKIAWSVLSALGCAVAHLVFVRNLPRRPAWLATTFAVFSFGSYLLATSLNVEGLYTPLLVAVVGGTLELERRPSWWLVAALAILNGLALLTREEHLVLLALLSAFVAWRWRRTASSAAVSPAATSMARLAMPLVVFAGAVLLCLPYSLHATRATQRYNTVPKRPPLYDAGPIVWTPEARLFVDSLPAFVRAKTVDLVSDRYRFSDVGTITADLARTTLVEFFGYLPDPLHTPVFIASHGPMSFALANHPLSNGGFSRIPLQTTLHPDSRLNLALPEHLRIFNHGYAVGWGYISGDLSAWLSNVGKKLWHAYQGAALGFTAYNVPVGRYGERRSCDLLTPLPGQAQVWQLVWGLLLIAGTMVAWKNSDGHVWLLVVAYKVAIVVAYYGYSRQATSILPVIFVIAALGADDLFERLRGILGGRPAQRRTMRRPVIPAVQTGKVLPRLLISVVTLGACAAEFHAATHPPAYDIVGPIQPLPLASAAGGPRAFSANATIQLRPQSGM